MGGETMRDGIFAGRKVSFAIILAVYVIAAAVGVITYRAVQGSWQLRLLTADAAATATTFIFSVIFKNASVYDPYWSVQPIFIVTAFAFGKEITPAGVLVMAAIWLWGVRLTANWAYTFHGLYHQDWRYSMLKEKTGIFYPVINFVGIHMVPTLVVYGCTLPAVQLVLNGAAVNAGSVIFFIVSLGAAALQTVADIQMHSFRRRRIIGFMQEGVWKYSRHPNYLGEILMWWGVALQALCLFPDKLWLLAGAAANTLLFLCVSIPLADGRQSRKPGFAEYKKATRMLLPLKKQNR